VFYVSAEGIAQRLGLRKGNQLQSLAPGAGQGDPSAPA